MSEREKPFHQDSLSLPPEEIAWAQKLQTDMYEIGMDIAWLGPLPQPNDLIPLPGETVPFSTLRDVMLSRLHHYTHEVTSRPPAQPHHNERHVMIPRGQNNTFHTLGYIDRRALAAFFIKKKKAAKEMDAPMEKLSPAELYAALNKKAYPIDSHPESNAVPELVTDVRLETAVIPEWMAEQPVNILLIRSDSGGNLRDFDQRAIDEQIRQDRTIPLFTKIKFGQCTQAEIVPAVAGNYSTYPATEAEYTTSFRPMQDENLTDLRLILREYYELFHREVTIPVLSILNNNSSQNNAREFVDTVADFVNFSNRFFGYSIILESPYKRKPIRQLLMENIGSREFLNNTLILDAADGQEHENTLKLIDFVLVHAKPRFNTPLGLL
ncbi:MAG TPA: hypothetical protein VLF89_00650 [Candidatus Saccharimonadales bacterium]|nr:hypothetical protein [Candidatus Saccharimonadales bacterium]